MTVDCVFAEKSDDVLHAKPMIWLDISRCIVSRKTADAFGRRGKPAADSLLLSLCILLHKSQY